MLINQIDSNEYELLVFIAHRTGCDEPADIVQNVICEFLAKPPQRVRNAESYIRRAVKNRAINSIRRKGRHEQPYSLKNITHLVETGAAAIP